MRTAIGLTHAAELWTKEGPTGDHVEVIRGEVQDHGGNVLFAGTADECVAQKYRVPTRLVPTEWRKVDGEVGHAEYTWELVIA
jgi:hypothetical protein